MELGQILMNATVNGKDVEVTAGNLLLGVMTDATEVDVTAKQTNIGELNISGDTVAVMKSANKSATRRSVENNQVKKGGKWKKTSWAKKKLGKPKQESRQEVWHNKPFGLRRRIRREDAYKAKGGFKAGPKAKVTVTRSIGKPTSTKCYCVNCRSNRRAAAIWFQGGKVGDHPAQAECVA
jgi:hypothetical protein